MVLSLSFPAQGKLEVEDCDVRREEGREIT